MQSYVVSSCWQVQRPSVVGAEGGVVVLRVYVTGNPTPDVYWRKGPSRDIDIRKGRFRLVDGGSLQVCITEFGQQSKLLPKYFFSDYRIATRRPRRIRLPGRQWKRSSSRCKDSTRCRPTCANSSCHHRRRSRRTGQLPGDSGCYQLLCIRIPETVCFMVSVPYMQKKINKK